MAEEGADVIDVGGESSNAPARAPVDPRRGAGSGSSRSSRGPSARTRPHRTQGPALRRHGETRGCAAAAVGRRASLINDISASLWEVAATTGAGWVAMQLRGQPRTMQDDPRYDDVVAEVQAFGQCALALAARRPGSPRSGSTRDRLRQDRRPQPPSCSATCGELVDAAASADLDRGVLVGASRNDVLGPSSRHPQDRQP